MQRSTVVVGVVAVLVLALVAAFVALRGSDQRGAAASPSASASAVSSPALTATAAPTASPVTASPTPSPTPRGEFVNAKYGYAVTQPDPYHPSTLSRDYGTGKHPAAVDYFTVMTPAEEVAAGSTGSCDPGCFAQGGAAVVFIYTDAGSMTPRQWFDAGNTPGSPGRLTDVTIAGRPALKIVPSGKYELMYVVADGKGRMYHLAYELFHVANPPAGASREKLDQLLASFRFVG